MLSKELEPETARYAFRNFALETFFVGLLVFLAQRILNKSDVPGERLYDPAAGIIIAAMITIGSIVVIYRYFKRTEEHDLIAHLWALALGYLSLALVKSIWRLLHDSNVLGPMNEGTAFMISLIVACLVWAWHKFR